MLTALNPGESLTAVLAGSVSSAQPTYSANWRDNFGGASLNAPVGRLNGTSAVTLVAADAAVWYQRLVFKVQVHNTDTSDIVVTLAKVSAGVSYTLAKITLQAGDMLIYDERGLIVVNSSGAAESVSN